MNYCENCGCKIYDGACVNCHEELYILDQYNDLGMEPPSREFMEKCYDQMKEAKENRKKLKDKRRNKE